jgi:thiamine-monophosphate kinase
MTNMEFTTEKEFINFIRTTYAENAPELLRTFGEDCAVIRITRKESFIISCDDLIEGTHFLYEYLSLYEVGQKALMTNISDIISLGHAPSYYLVSLLLPRYFPKEKTGEIYAGMHAIADRYHIILIGGNTEVYKGPLAIRITIIARTKNNYFLFRNNAKPGDLLYISNNIGLSALGLALFQKGWRKRHSDIITDTGQKERRTWLKRAIMEYGTPSLPFELSLVLAKHRLARCAIDISDGLLSDLQEICNESGVGASIYEEMLPVPPGIKKFCNSAGIDYYSLMLTGGEDYQLLFTVPEKNIKKLSALPSFSSARCIGKIKHDKQHRITCYSQGKEKSFPAYQGYNHFRKK